MDVLAQRFGIRIDLCARPVRRQFIDAHFVGKPPDLTGDALQLCGANRRSHRVCQQQQIFFEILTEYQRVLIGVALENHRCSVVERVEVSPEDQTVAGLRGELIRILADHFAIQRYAIREALPADAVDENRVLVLVTVDRVRVIGLLRPERLVQLLLYPLIPLSFICVIQPEIVDIIQLVAAFLIFSPKGGVMRNDPFEHILFLVGEILGGDYKVIMGDDKFHSATNYECYKGIYSAFNSMNMFEIVHSLIRQFGSDPWTLYHGYHLLSFVDNHDVTRIATILQDKKHLPLVYAMCFGMPGIPCIYYGSEWGEEGDKKNGDPSLRPCFEKPQWNELSDWISRLAAARKKSDALCQGDFRSVLLTNRQCIFERKTDKERVLVAINADSEEYVAHFDAGCGMAVDLISGKKHDFGGGSHLPPYSASFWLMEK